ncbi:MAG: type II toxin-antitoxin system ParD family antitoxin [Pirellulaceae bacterium]|nr:type II toxin-antitoxin system ParD family antitoxin [Pirellulaceae bacterium]
MTEALPPDIQRFVDQAVASGEYDSPDACIVAALRAFRELRERHQQLRADIQHAIEQSQRGESRPLDMEAVKAEARRLHAQQSHG